MDEFSDAAMRPLPWELRDQAAMSADTGPNEGDDNPFVWPEDPDERTLIVFNLSQREYTAIASAIDVGSDIAFGVDAIRVWWLFVQNMRYNVSLCDAIAQAILTCEDVQVALATAIATNEGIQDSIRDFVINDPEINDHIADAARVSVLTPSEQVENLLKPDQCGYSYIFNQVTVLVDLLNTLSNDIFEALIVGTNPLERAEILLSAIPAIGAVIPFDEILAFANELVEDVKEDYENKYDEALEDELRCGLFCLMRDDCVLSISDAMLYYSTKASETLPAEPLAALQATIQLFLAGVLPGDWIVYMMHLLVLACIQAGENVIGVDFAQLGIRLVAAGDEPDNDWMVLCTECPPEPETCDGATLSYDFRISDGDFISSPVGINYANYHAGEGWGPNDGAFRISIDRIITGTITKVVAFYNQGISFSLTIRSAYVNGWAAQGFHSSPTGVDDDEWFWEFDGLSFADGISVETGSGAFPADLRLTRLCIWLAP